MVLNVDWAKKFFSKRIERYFPGAKKLLDIDIKIKRNFRGKFRNMSLEYKLDILFGNHSQTKIVRAKINSQHLNPKRHYQALCFLAKNGFLNSIPRPLDYISSLNMVLYEDLKGESFQDMLASHKNINVLFDKSSDIAKLLYRLHHLPIKNKNSFFQGGKQFELSLRRHWAFLVRKCAPNFYPKMRYLLDKVWQEKKKQNISSVSCSFTLIHGDFHWGNILLSEQGKIGFLDFGNSRLDDPLIDVASFVVQTESMFRYYCPKKEKLKQKIINQFLDTYFPKKMSPDFEKRLLYFEVNQYLQMAAIHSFVESDLNAKVEGVKALMSGAEEKLNQLENLRIKQ